LRSVGAPVINVSSSATAPRLPKNLTTSESQQERQSLALSSSGDSGVRPLGPDIIALIDPEGRQFKPASRQITINQMAGFSCTYIN
jgi:hypothetical protein